MARISRSELIKLQRKHTTDAAIGAVFGISRQAVHQLRVKYGIESVSAKNDERNAKILAMHEAGKTGPAIARRFKLSLSQIFRIVKAGESRGRGAKKKGNAETGRKKK
jgi:hypothetical protein